jgi:TetR/AcrR family transcriptional regulator
MGVSTSKLPPARRDAARSRQAILDSAERLFAERSYQATTMAEIGSAAGLSTGAPAYFFGSKEELYRAVLGRLFEETARVIRGWRLGEADPEQGVREAVGSYLDFLAAHPSFVRLVVREALEGGRFLRGLPEHLSAIAEAMAVVIAGIGGGRLRPEIDPAHLLLSGISLCWFPMVAGPLTQDLGLGADSPEFLTVRKRQVSELLLSGAMSLERKENSR